jgi:hypothetical protein
MEDRDRVPESPETVESPELSQEDIDTETSGEELPDREAMSLINANLALPINAAIAANVLSDGSIAYADANQGDTITQGTGGTGPATTNSG